MTEKIEIGNRSPRPWYFKTSTLVVALLCVGPLALPLLWFNPHFNIRNKVLITIAALVLTYLLSLALIQAVKSLLGYYKELDQLF